MTFDPNEPKAPVKVEDEVEAALENHEVVLFMKGSELMPQCGYSKKALNLVKRYRGDVEVVNVLDGPVDVYRDALEEHSDWSTIPQAFVEGEFIGGADVLGELDENGELAEKLGVDEPASPPF